MDKRRTCQGCPDREPGCHGRCPGYQERHQANQEKNRDKLFEALNTYQSDLKPLIMRRNGK